MTEKQYRDAVVDLFKSGKATEEQYQEMALWVTWANDNFANAIPFIDGGIERP